MADGLTSLSLTKWLQQCLQAERGSRGDIGNLLRNISHFLVPKVVNATASLTLNPLTHAGKTVTLNAAAGLTVTLPAATGTGHIYRLFVGTTITSNNYVIQVANATDVLAGGLAIATDIAGVVENTAATDDTITMNGTTTGGVIGGHIELEDVAAGYWRLSGFLVSTGVEASPFSAAVA